ncbi:T9SS type A sorting domain-containing protein [candidate division KSB1 bacterium]|nr:T9SS type A sorting domain-containing protein [candidate division KSB1 bacterium]
MRQFVVTVFVCVFLFAGFAAAEDFFLPFMQKATAPINVDGVLDEWNFCFPIDVREITIPENSRAYDWFPDGDEDVSGTVMLMWDEDNLYVAGNIRDDVPGVLPQPPGWSGDVIEIYLGNYDVGYEPWDPTSDGTVMHDDPSGKFAVQFAFFYDADYDSVRIFQHSHGGGVLNSENTKGAGKVWPNSEGYMIEAQLAWDDVISANGNTFDPQAGDVIPFTLSLYDRDDWEADDFQGLAYSERSFPAYQGPGKGWQTIEVKGARETAWYKDSFPYFKMSNGPVTVDGDLSEWNFCFPIDMNQSSIPDYSRANAWLPEDDADCSAPLKFMFDENYLYVGASVRDDVPGVVVDPVVWDMDAVELYMGNYDIGAMGEVPDHTGYINEGDMLDVQLAFYYDADNDVVLVNLWNPGDKAGLVPEEAAMGAGKVWANGEGYDLEVAISLADFALVVDDAGERTFNFVDHLYEIFPTTYALYDRDDWDTSDWSGYQYVADAAAPYLGPGAGGWEGVQLLPKNSYDILGWLWDNYTAVEDKPTTVANYHLAQNYPNPFNPSTTIEYSVQNTQHVTLAVYNVLGEQVASLVNTTHPAGDYRLLFDGTNLTGGVYFYKLTAGDYSETRRMILLK